MIAKNAAKQFQGATAKAAEAAALTWSNDLKQHPAVTVESITVRKKWNRFIATIIYRE
jgi:hypothetical protein